MRVPAASAAPATAAGLAAALLISAAPARATEKETVAVIVLGASATDGDLADNVTEVVIARVAERGDVRTVGARELRYRVATDGAANDPLPGCAGDAGCLLRTALTLGAARAVVGSVGARDGRFQLELTLQDLESGHVQAHVTRVTDVAVGELVAAAQDATDELFAPAPAEPPPKPLPRLEDPHSADARAVAAASPLARPAVDRGAGRATRSTRAVPSPSLRSPAA